MSRSDGMIVQKRMSFLSSLVWGLCSVIMVTVICASGLALYGMNVINASRDNVVALLENVVGDVPGVVKSIPLLADAISNERRLDYMDDLDIQVSFDDSTRHEGLTRTVVTVANNGDELVALLCLRVVVKDEHGHIVDEEVHYVATPLPIDDDVPGPLMPSTTRQATIGAFRGVDHPTAEYEISEIRVWVENAPDGV